MMPEEKYVMLGGIGHFADVLNLFRDGWQRDKTFTGMGNESTRIYRLFRYSEEELAEMEAIKEGEERPIEDVADIRQPHPEKDVEIVESLKKRGYVYTNKWKGCVELTLWEDVALDNLAREEAESEEGRLERIRDEEARTEHEEGAPPG